MTDEVVYEYTYMSPGGFPDDYAGLPTVSRSYAEYVADSFPEDNGVIMKRIISGPWIEA